VRELSDLKTLRLLEVRVGRELAGERAKERVDKEQPGAALPRNRHPAAMRWKNQDLN